MTMASRDHTPWSFHSTCLHKIHDPLSRRQSAALANLLHPPTGRTGRSERGR